MDHFNHSLTPGRQEQKDIPPHHWNDTAREYPHHITIHELFEKQADATPDKVAITYGNRQLTYKQLNEQSNQLAHYLRGLHIGLDVTVGICADRNLELIVGFLAILKAGGTYVPLDPDYPPERLKFMLKDSNAKVLLTMASMRKHLHDFNGIVVCLDSDQSRYEKESRLNVSSGAAGQNLAYIIYTSGSTGVPKGVAVPHKAVNRLVCNTDYLQIEATDRVAQASNGSFDAATFEIWGTLLNGGQLIGVAREMILAPSQLAAFLKSWHITVFFITTALFNQLAREAPEAFSKLRCLLFGGEAVDPRCVRQVIYNDPPSRFLHVYGPTESTTFSTWYAIEKVAEDAQTVPIGIPIANTQAYILDRNFEQVPIGVPGELYIGGEGLAREYYNHPVKTAENFIPNAFSNLPGARLYKTGDTVRYLPDGNIEFIGRKDFQVKIHGFRIELAEIEAILGLYPKVEDVIVMVRKDVSGQKKLIAYVTTPDPSQIAGNDLRAFLKHHLPDYMLPHVYMFLACFPLTPNGKVDRQALPAPDWKKQYMSADYVSPRTPLEKKLVDIYAEVLGLDRVGVQDNFHELGGHSLNAVQIVSRVRDILHIELPLLTVIDSPTILDVSRFIQNSALVDKKTTIPQIHRISRNQTIPLSFSQERIWFLQQLDTGSRAYNFQATFKFSGHLKQEALEYSLNEMVRRHEILRTTFPETDSGPVQLIHAPCPVKLPVIDLRNVPVEDRDSELNNMIRQEFERSFDITRLPLIRWLLFRLADDVYVMTHMEHHLIHDGWSFNVFLGELWQLYRANSQDESSPLADPEIQFADFASWQRHWMEGEEARKQLSYWTEKLADVPPVLELPFDRPRSATQSYRGAALKTAMPKGLGQNLVGFSQKEGMTLFITLLTGFVITLHRFSGQEDLAIGVGMAGRRWSQTEKLLGMIINNVVLRSNLTGNPRIKEILSQVRTTTWEATANQDIPFDHVVRTLHPERSPGHNPIYQVMFDLHDAPLDHVDLPGLEGTLDLGLNSGAAKFDMTVIVIPAPARRFGKAAMEPQVHNELTVIWEYNTDLFDADTIDRMYAHFIRVLQVMTENPLKRLSDLPLLSETEKKQLLVDWNETASNYPRNQTIHSLFESQAQKTPEAIALAAEEQQINYRELNVRANQLARFLRRNGVGPEVMVGIYVERSIEMVVAILAILKAGGAYVPLDPDSPAQRLSFIIDEIKPPVILTQSRLFGQLPDSAAKIVCLDADLGKISQEKDQNPSSIVTSDNLAYVMYTSGSTGHPKGTSINHRSVVRLVKKTNYVTISARDIFLQFAPLSFDASTFEIWASLLNGAKLVLFPPSRPSLHELADYIRREEISTLWLTASLFNQMVDEHLDCLLGVRQILTGGEVLSVPHVQKVVNNLGGRNRLVNGYGPTENTTFTACHIMSASSRVQRSVPIGTPIANSRTYVLDDFLQPVPLGVYGELFIGGEGLARSYLNQPALTAEKFVPDPFSDKEGGRLYRTGDIVRYLKNGDIEFLGRQDFQVKIRGFRIELGEIEMVLGKHPAVDDAVVICRQDNPAEKQLVAYVVTRCQPLPQADSLKRFLAEQLPSYMVPSLFVFLDTLPLTQNGKLDRNLLPAPDKNLQETTGEIIPPRTETEKDIISIWQDVLRIDKVGPLDNFFDLGGHSLLATQVMSRVRNQFLIELPLRCFFETPTVEGLARHIEAARLFTNSDKGSFGVFNETEEGEI